MSMPSECVQVETAFDSSCSMVSTIKVKITTQASRKIGSTTHGKRGYCQSKCTAFSQSGEHHSARHSNASLIASKLSLYSFQDALSRGQPLRNYPF